MGMTGMRIWIVIHFTLDKNLFNKKKMDNYYLKNYTCLNPNVTTVICFRRLTIVLLLCIHYHYTTQFQKSFIINMKA